MVTYVASWVAVILNTKKKKKKKKTNVYKNSNPEDLKNIDIGEFLQPPHGS